MKKLFSVMALITMIAVIIIACKDNFNEKDFLNLQAKLKRKNDSLAALQANKTKSDWVTQQVAALNTSGKLLAFTVQVVEDGKPLSGVAVLVTNDASASSSANTATTDANGNAIFKNLPIGGNNVVISKSGYITASMIVDFGVPSQNVDYAIDASTGAIIPLGRTESVTAPIFPNSATGSTAVIKGTVTIENDLTNAVNAADALPAGLVVQANYNSAVAVVDKSGATRVKINSYTFNDTNIGTGTVTNGAYSITVPASAGGTSINLIVPTITGTKKMALNGQNNVAFATPQYINVPTVWGPTTAVPGGYSGAAPTVVGATISFPNPPGVGAGLASAITFPTAVPRSLSFTNQSIPAFQTSTLYSANIAPPSNSNTTTFLFDKGTGPFASSPIITLTGGGASAQATLKTSLSGSVTSVSGISPGTLYTSNITFDIQYKDTNSPANTITVASFSVPPSSGGLPANIDLNATIVAGSLNFNTFTGPRDVSAGGFFVANIAGTGGSGAAISTVNVSSQISGIFSTSSGAGYTSAPTIAITGGGTPVALPALSILDFGLQWNMVFTAASITSPYSVLPTIRLNTGISNGSIPVNYALTTAVSDQNNNGLGGGIQNAFQINGNTISVVDPSGGVLALRTSNFSAAAPTVVITDIVPAVANANLGGAGNINALTANPSGGIVSITEPGGFAGKGYNAVFAAGAVTIQPSITGAPGTGATLGFNSTHFTRQSTGEWQWNGGFIITNPGSGYLANLNQTTSQINFAGGGAVTVVAGQTYTNNIFYGTGQNQTPVQ